MTGHEKQLYDLFDAADSRITRLMHAQRFVAQLAHAVCDEHHGKLPVPNLTWVHAETASYMFDLLADEAGACIEAVSAVRRAL